MQTNMPTEATLTRESKRMTNNALPSTLDDSSVVVLSGVVSQLDILMF